MNKKQNWEDFKNILDNHNITKLYHFTDRSNLESIIENGGLYSWMSCDRKGITISRPGGSSMSRDFDSRKGLGDYVRVSFTPNHPMMYVAMNDGRISNPHILEIDPEVIFWENTKFADRNAAKNGVSAGSSLGDFEKIHFESVKANRYFDLSSEEQPYFQAEVLVPQFIPLRYITNIGNFVLPIPQKPEQLQAKDAYTAQISRNTPTAFIFLIDQSLTMGNKTTFNGEEMILAEAVARIVNRQINELVMRCIKANEIRHYYDIAVIGYGDQVYSGWKGNLEGRFFVSPQELNENPYMKKTVREEIRTRKGTTIKEVEKVQWVEARHDGNWTHVHKAFDKAKELLDEWLVKYHDKDCYPPTIINVTDGEFNGTTKEEVQQRANELKQLFTNDGNVLLFNIHITKGDDGKAVLFPISKGELDGNWYGETIFDLSSLLPIRYNQQIAQMRNDNTDERHVAMAINADMSTLIQLMDIGTPMNISQNK